MLTGRVNLRRGDAREVRVYAGTEAINLGDIVCQVDGGPVPASEIAWDNDLATTQTAAITAFLGVALDKQINLCNNMEPGMWLVGAQGDYNFTCDPVAEVVEIGTLVGPAENDEGDGLEADKVAEVPAAARAIGVVVERAPVGATQVLVRVRSTLADRVLN